MDLYNARRADTQTHRLQTMCTRRRKGRRILTTNLPNICCSVWEFYKSRMMMISKILYTIHFAKKILRHKTSLGKSTEKNKLLLVFFFIVLFFFPVAGSFAPPPYSMLSVLPCVNCCSSPFEGQLQYQVIVFYFQYRERRAKKQTQQTLEASSCNLLLCFRHLFSNTPFFFICLGCIFINIYFFLCTVIACY